MIDAHRETYKEEARELLGELETSLLELEECPEDKELIGRVFRAMHTIKGSGAMFGFDDIAGFAHGVETVLDQVREGKIGVSKNLIDLTLAACDQIRKMVEGEEGNKEKVAEVAESFQAILEGRKGQPTRDKSREPEINVPAAGASGKAQDAHVTYRIRFRPYRQIFQTGTNPLLLLGELRALGPNVVVAQTDEIPDLRTYDPELCYTFWDIVLTTDKGTNAIKDVFIFVEDVCEIKIDVVDEADLEEQSTDYKKLGEILIERGDIALNALQEALAAQKRVGQVLLETKMVTPGMVESALAEQEHVRDMRKKREEAVVTSSVRVSADKLDALVNLVGELVTVQANLNRVAVVRRDPELIALSEQVERLSNELRDNTMGIRMLPIGSTFNKFRRLVRDLSQGLGKEVELVTEGGDTELDKTVIERLNDPLVHIIRNCIDHGVESPEERECAGKARQGIVRLAAEHSGANVLIRIADDGGGLDAVAIRNKAVEKGLLAADAELPESALFAMIFAPGFSTAKQVSDVSGRGVGMDVVKKNIEALRGSVEIQSRRGVGTTIILKLPLTLAIIEGLMVKVGEGYFVFPLALVESCLELYREEALKSQERSMMNVRGEIVPYLNLRDLFVVRGDRPEIEQVVVAESGGDKMCFGVDHVVGQLQTVIKGLGRAYKDVRGISGATILGDGTVALILDIAQLVEAAKDGHKHRSRHQVQ